MNPSLSHNVVQRARVRLFRKGPAANLTHLNQIDMIRHALIKSEWPLSYSEGRKPKVRASFGPAISVGYESEAEYFDVDLSDRIDLKTAIDPLHKCLAEGYAVASIKSIPLFFPSLESTINAALFELSTPALAGTEDKWKEFDAKPRFLVTKKKADGDVVIDAKECVRTWSLTGPMLTLELRFGPRRTLKPERIVQAVYGFNEDQVLVGPAEALLHVTRKKLFFERQDGGLMEI